MKPPEVDRLAASKAAVAARRARAEVKAQVANGLRSILDVARAAWIDRSSAEAGLRVRELLLSLPKFGPVKVERILASLEISKSRKLGGLGVRQRARFERWFEAEEAESGSETFVRAHEPKLVVLAGPTAVGKGAVSDYIRANYPEVLISVSATTRSPRPGEVDGVNYRFVSDEEFDELESSGEMLETATVHNAYRYGTPAAPIREALESGRSVLLEIDLQGARAVRKAVPDALLIFLLPPSWEELVRRLTGRGTESAAEQARRLATAKIELEAQDEFDFRVVNSDVAQAAAEVVELMGFSGKNQG